MALALEVPEALELAEQVVERLLADPHRAATPVGRAPWGPGYRNTVKYAAVEVVESTLPQPLEHVLLDRLPGDAQEGTGAAVGPRSPNPVPSWVLADCGSGVSAAGLRVFTCESGGAAVGHPHPKELLVLRDDGSSAAYPEWGGQGVAAGDGEVVAFHDLNVVRVTSSGLVPLVTPDELARALHVRPTAIVWPMNHLRVDARGDVYFSPSVPIRSYGCWNPLVERTAGGKIREIQASVTPSTICQ